MTVAFNTTPTNGGTNYQITDVSSGFNPAQYSKKIVKITAPDNTVLYEDDNVPLTTNVINVPVDAALWFAHLGTLQISVDLYYVQLSGASDQLGRAFVLPTTLNLPL